MLARVYQKRVIGDVNRRWIVELVVYMCSHSGMKNMDGATDMGTFSVIVCSDENWWMSPPTGEVYYLMQTDASHTLYYTSTNLDETPMCAFLTCICRKGSYPQAAGHILLNFFGVIFTNKDLWMCVTHSVCMKFTIPGKKISQIPMRKYSISTHVVRYCSARSALAFGKLL